MVFAYSPAMLIVLDEYFTWVEFIHTAGTCILGIVMLGAALTGYLLRPIGRTLRVVLGVAAIMMVTPDLQTNLWSIAVASPVLVAQLVSWRRSRG